MNSKYEAIKQFAAEHIGRAEIIEHETAIVDLASGAQVFDVNQAAATYIVEAKEGVFAVVASAAAHLKWRQLGRELELHQIHLASPEAVKDRTGYDVGTVCRCTSTADCSRTIRSTAVPKTRITRLPSTPSSSSSTTP